jgi:hypothetical protein
MPYDLHQFNPAEIAAIVTERSAALKANRGVSDLASYGLGVVWRRLQKEPVRYRDYGPYWWALKSLLRGAGYPVDDNTDPVIEAAYRGRTAAETVVMADEFRTQYLATQAVGTSVFDLSTDGVAYVLEDGGMEHPA